MVVFNRVFAAWDEFFFGKNHHLNFSISRFAFFMLIFFYYFVYTNYNGEVLANQPYPELFKPVSFFKYLPIWPLPDAAFMDVVVNVWGGLLLMSAFGVFPRLVFPMTFLFTICLLGIPINFGKVYHNTHLPVLVMAVFCFCRSAGPWSLSRWLTPKKKVPLESPEYKWPIRFVWLIMAIIYFLSGFQKLRFGGMVWMGSENISTIILSRHTITPLGFIVAQSDLLALSFGVFTVVFELFAPIALFFRSMRWFIFGCFFMHFGALLVLGQDGGFIPYMTCFVFWLPWNWLWQKMLAFLSFLSPVQIADPNSAA